MLAHLFDRFTNLQNWSLLSNDFIDYVVTQCKNHMFFEVIYDQREKQKQIQSHIWTIISNLA